MCNISFLRNQLNIKLTYFSKNNAKEQLFLKFKYQVLDVFIIYRL